MNSPSTSTEFAPADRADRVTVSRQSQLISNSALLRQLFDAVNESVLILNQQRQIVFCNRTFAEVFGSSDATLRSSASPCVAGFAEQGSSLRSTSPHSLLGLRPGEAMDCVHAGQSSSGCGTSEFCSTCGAVQAILASQSGNVDTLPDGVARPTEPQGIDAQVTTKECRVLRGKTGDALDLLVRTTPLTLGGEPFVVFAVTDISHEKRRRALERVFFHDVMNTMAGLQLFADLLQRAGAAKVGEIACDIQRGIDRLVQEVTGHRELMAAENHELPVRPIHLSSLELLNNVFGDYRHYEEVRHCRLVMDPQAADVTIWTDISILARILGNMVKNAIEASDAGQTVTMGCRTSESNVQFWVHNPGFMPREVQLQVFNRSFSTKGTGRGLGTYSMKLLTERYLKGQVSFTTSPTDGTKFTVELAISSQ